MVHVSVVFIQLINKGDFWITIIAPLFLHLFKSSVIIKTNCIVIEYSNFWTFRLLYIVYVDTYSSYYK